MSIPRPEHPNPQFERADWINLNGVWTYELDPGCSGRARGRMNATGFEPSITVPFCPESKLSGVGHTDFITGMWYHRKIQIPPAWAGRQIVLHLGGVDYECEVFIDGQSVDMHFGGTVGFAMDISRFVQPGQENHLTLRVHDDVRSGTQPGGKQCPAYNSRGCHYTRTTGIWQTVWLEAVHPQGLRDVRIVPDLDGSQFVITPVIDASSRGLKWRVKVDGKPAVTSPLTQCAAVCVPIDNPKPWSPSDPHLYDLTFEVLDGDAVIDTVHSYAGLRKVHLEGDRIYLNNEPIFLRLVLDQGFYPEGIWTAPSDEALRADIELSMAAGFNGARLHQKVFEPRFHYWADKLGYLSWGESSSWGVNAIEPPGMRNFIPEWGAIIERDRNHPSIIAWTPLNESWTRGSDEHHRTIAELYEQTRRLDPTRPVNTSSGGNWYKHDITTYHDYAQDPASLKAHMDDRFAEGKCGNIVEADRRGIMTGPLVIDEYGGTRWSPSQELGSHASGSWGYGEAPRSIEECLDRMDKLTQVIVNHDAYCGYCYTQLTDVEQEQNGVYYYDRSAKFDAARVHAIFSARPDWSAW